MGANFRRALQIAVMLSIIVLGVIIRIQAADNSIVGVCVLELTALGVVGFGLSEFATSPATLKSATPGQDDPQGTLRPTEQRLAKELAKIARVVESRIPSSEFTLFKFATSRQPRPAAARKTRASPRGCCFADRRELDHSGKSGRTLAKFGRVVAQIEDLRADLAEANERALRDPTTALGNRHFFEQKLHQGLADARADMSEMCLLV